MKEKRILCEDCVYGAFYKHTGKCIYCTKKNTEISKYLNKFKIAKIEDIPTEILANCSGYKKINKKQDKDESFVIDISYMRQRN